MHHHQHQADPRQSTQNCSKWRSGTFNLSVQTGVGTITATNQGDGGMTAYQQSLSGSVTVAETSGANTSITKYITGITCLNDVTSAAVSPTPSFVFIGTTVLPYLPHQPPLTGLVRLPIPGQQILQSLKPMVSIQWLQAAQQLTQ